MIEKSSWQRYGWHPSRELSPETWRGGLELDRGVLSRWKRQLASDGKQAFPGKAHLEPEDEEMRRLKRENERFRRERDILKKAVAINSFSFFFFISNYFYLKFIRI
jgi:hypothetical protein